MPQRLPSLTGGHRPEPVSTDNLSPTNQQGRPLSPWGNSATQKRFFTYRSAFGNREFDTTDAACEPFGLFHNDRVRFGVGAWAGKKGTVLGVSHGVLWVLLDDEEYAQDLKGCFDAEAIQKKYRVQVLEEEEELAWPESPNHPNIQFVAARDEEQLKAFEYRGTMETYLFRCTLEDTEPFGYHHAQRVRATRGAQRGRTATVIGVNSGVLWVHFDDERGATPCNFCNSKADLDAKYGFKVISSPDISEISTRGGKIDYLGPFGMMYSFEKSDDALKPYGVKHGQRVRITKGSNCDKEAVVIGVQTGVLWLHVEGDKSASPCTFCNNADDLQQKYGLVPTGERATVRASEPVYSPKITGAELRQKLRDEILEVPLDDDTWDEGQQPQTYRFLRAYARWRLPKSTPTGQAFMLFYVKDTAPRTAEALANLNVLRKYWRLQQKRGSPEFDKPFANASEKEMLHCLQQIPLCALTILSATSP